MRKVHPVSVFLLHIRHSRGQNPPVLTWNLTGSIPECNLINCSLARALPENRFSGQLYAYGAYLESRKMGRFGRDNQPLFGFGCIQDVDTHAWGC